MLSLLILFIMSKTINGVIGNIVTDHTNRMVYINLLPEGRLDLSFKHFINQLNGACLGIEFGEFSSVDLNKPFLINASVTYHVNDKVGGEPYVLKAKETLVAKGAWKDGMRVIHGKKDIFLKLGECAHEGDVAYVESTGETIDYEKPIVIRADMAVVEAYELRLARKMAARCASINEI